MLYSYDDAVKLLTSVGRFRIELGLGRVAKFLELIGNPQDNLRYIHVAGTNGKGSVCAIINSILNCANYKVGLYTSPHLFKYTERIKICNHDISEDDFTNNIFKIVDIAQKNNIDLTEFEILTCVMFKYFSDNNVEVVVLETGLGGRFDATNVIKNNICSVITHVDLDHTERLGNTRDKIAFEKAGIIKPNCPCIVFEGYDIYREMADKNNSMLMMIAPFADTKNLALKGIYQQENLSLVLTVIEEFFPDISQSVIDEGLKNVQHPCRFQYIEDKNVLIDGAHNPNGVEALVQSLNYYYPDKKIRIIFGCLKNKDYEKMVKTLATGMYYNPEIYFYKFNHANSTDAEILQECCPIESKILTNFDEIILDDNVLTVICGSLYMIKEVTEALDIKIF